MPRHWKTETIDVRDVKFDAPIYPPMLRAVKRIYAHPDTPVEHLAMPAGNVNVPELSPLQAEFVAMCPRNAFTELRRWREEDLYVMPVLRRADGSVWAYDDAAVVSLYHRHAPGATVHVAIIGADPA